MLEKNVAAFSVAERLRDVTKNAQDRMNIYTVTCAEVSELREREAQVDFKFDLRENHLRQLKHKPMSRGSCAIKLSANWSSLLNNIARKGGVNEPQEC